MKTVFYCAQLSNLKTSATHSGVLQIQHLYHTKYRGFAVDFMELFQIYTRGE